MAEIKKTDLPVGNPVGESVQSTAKKPSTNQDVGDTKIQSEQGRSPIHGRGGQFVALGGGRIVPASETE